MQKKITLILSGFALLCSVALQAQTPVLSYTFDKSNALGDDSQTYTGYLNEGAVVEDLSGNKVLFIYDETGWFDLNTNAAKGRLAGLSDFTITIDFYQKEEGNRWDAGFCLWTINDEYSSQRLSLAHLPWAWEIQWPDADGVSDKEGEQRYFGIPHSAVKKGEWNTITITKSDNLSFFVNGELQGTTQGNANISILPEDFFATTGLFAIGKSSLWWDPAPQNACFDNFKVFNAALTQPEIAALYAARPADPFLLDKAKAALQKTIDHAKKILLSGLAPTPALQTAISAAATVIAGNNVENINAENGSLKAAIRTYYKGIMALGTFIDKIAEATFDEDAIATDFTATYTSWQLTPLEESHVPEVGVRAGVAEFYMSAAVLSQEIRNLQNGYYLAYVQAFYRDDEERGAKFFANKDTVDVIRLFDEVIDYTNINPELLNPGDYPASMESASAVFTANPDLYGNYVIVKVTDRTLQIGIEKPAYWYWVLFNNFKLYSIPYTGSAIPNINASVATDENAPVFNVLGNIVGKAKDLDTLPSGFYIVGGRKVLVRK